MCASGLSWFAWTYSPAHASAEPPHDRPIQVAHDGYVASSSCKACHPGEYGTWHRSYHRTMTQAADVDTVLGPIDGVVVRARDQSFALERRGREVWVEMNDPAWTGAPDAAPRVSRQIVQTTGSHNEQFYWIASGKGRDLTILPIMYRLKDEQRWGSLDGCCIAEPGFVQDLADGRWNRVCNRCHATHTQPRIVEGEGADTHVAELGIACEACHGPGGEHAEQNRDPRARYAQHFDEANAHAIVNPAKLDHKRSSEVCGQCHGVNVFHNDADREEWRAKGFRYRPGDVLADSRQLETSGPDRFWSDGMMRVSGREYNGLVRSPCFVNGELSCISCHSMHKLDEGDTRSLDSWADDQLHPGMDGDHACTQCHTSFTDPAAVAAHTHHPVGSTGSECMNCHMPYTTYGILKGIRSHEISNPSVDESVVTGRPNACNLCHLDRTLAWTGEHLERWYDIPTPALDADQRTVASGVLWSLRGDGGQRVLMACGMDWAPARAVSGSDWMVPFLAVLVQDPYTAVRYTAHRALSRRSEGAALARTDPLVQQPAELARVTNPIVDAWNRKFRKPAPSLLIDAHGVLDVRALQQLLSRRDERPVELNE
jgi:hypothetical protein